MTDKPEYLSSIEPFVNESEVYLIFKQGRRFLALIWDYSNEFELLQNAGWTILPTGVVTWKEFLIMVPDNKIMSNPYWTCNCETDFLYSAMNTPKCSVCGAQHPHQKNGFYGIVEHFEWNNVHAFSPSTPD